MQSSLPDNYRRVVRFIYYTIHCPLIVDPSVKELIINGLLETAKSRPSPPVEPRTSLVPRSTPSPPVEPATSSSSTPVEPCKTNVIHQWTASQEDMLVSIRHERATDFLKTKNHASIWKEITRQLNIELGCHINTQQATNKYNNLKKRWKEVIDSKSGSQTKYFRQRDAFDEAYGTRASTKPSFLIDSGSKKICLADKPNAGTSDNVMPTIKVADVVKTKNTPKKRSSELIELIKEQEADFKARIEHFHQDKMARMDRLLDLYERDINKKVKNTDGSTKD